MERHEAAEALRRIIRLELAECAVSIRDRDPVRALNDLADATRQLKAVADALERNLGPQSDPSPGGDPSPGDPPPGDPVRARGDGSSDLE